MQRTHPQRTHPPSWRWQRRRSALVAGGVVLLSAGFAHAQNTAKLPPPGAYVTIKNGHLSLGGQRVRYWGIIGGLYVAPQIKAEDSAAQREEKLRTARRGTDLLVQRYLDLGFNACRFWDSAPHQENYSLGDGSRADAMDYFVAKMKQRGLKMWAAGLNDAGHATSDDAAIVADAQSESWRQAIAQRDGGKVELRNNPARIWDARLEAIALANMKAVATHFNKYTGLRWCDDPVFAAWELSNEEWWMGRMLGGQWQKLPPFFKNQLIARWNTWLQTKYRGDAGLRAAWNGLLPGETLAQGSVLFAPMCGASSTQNSINDASPVARQALDSLKQEYSRADFSRQRGADVIEFLLSLQLAHKRREAAAVKSWGRSTQLSPLVHDTGIGYEIQSQFLHQQADVVAHDAYVNGTGPQWQPPDLSPSKTERERMYAMLDKERISANENRWVNWLRKPPGISQGVPWLEHNRVEGKPFFCYETQIQQPAKYRADFPLRLAALASIQDWDFVCWHYFGGVPDAGTAPRPFDKPMDITTGSHPQGYHFTYDEVQNAMMRAAGWMFRQNLLRAAPHPTRFIYGRKSLLDPDSMDYGGSYGTMGMDMLQTTYQYGVRVAIDARREDDRVIGPVVKFAERNRHNPYTPTGQIVFDWQRGFLSLDAPGAVAWTEQMAKAGRQIKFKNGVTLRDVQINNPAGIFEAIGEDEKYIAFALHALDGQSLHKTRRASLSLVSTSFNSGFKLGAEGEQTQAGGLPVLVARVGATIQAPALNGMRYTLHDWHMQPLGSGIISGGILRVPADQPVFSIELQR